MGISRYLAMTAAEMEAFSVPENAFPAYMACHFSPYAIGLSNVPTGLPAESMLIVNDRTPPWGHDPVQITRQLLQLFEQVRFSCLLLDFERPEVAECQRLCQEILRQLPCPVGVSEGYAGELDCAVFLGPPPLDQTLEAYTAPWKGRELWLDVAPEAACITVTENGNCMASVPFSVPPENTFTDDALHCRYRAKVFENEIQFHLWRDLQQIEALTEHAKSLGITKCISLFQELYYDK